MQDNDTPPKDSKSSVKTDMSNGESCLFIFLFAFFITIAIQLDDGPYRFYGAAMTALAAGYYASGSNIRRTIIAASCCVGFMAIGYAYYAITT